MNRELIGPVEQRRLLVLARQALEARVHRLMPPFPDERVERTALPPYGVFVTIRSRGELRGCLGRLQTSDPLSAIVADLAASVADSDPRFEPVSPSELPDIEIEISVLGPERLVTSIDEIEPGRHGLVVEHGVQRGLLLPQVAVEQGWDRETFLAQTWHKAGLPADAWRHGARVFVFEAHVFQDRD